jgi:hypothetical protein
MENEFVTLLATLPSLSIARYSSPFCLFTVPLVSYLLTFLLLPILLPRSP